MIRQKQITSLDIKYALMYYFRFKRQWICASECLFNDVMVITNKDVSIDVEIKINKYDLWKGEAKKSKHKMYKESTNPYWQFRKQFIPNRFYICVPTFLAEEAKLWVKQTNKKYGIILYHPAYHPSISISIKKKASKINKEVNKGLEREIMMRVCSENIGLMGKKILQTQSKKLEE